jgi:ATPase subunit of ABC transporter with duplicated ATPase domains
LLAEGESLAVRAGRDDLAAVVRTARIRLERPDTVVAVVGEFKQGKSSLVNALLGEIICPVDDDIATAVPTVIRYGEQRVARVQVRDGEEDHTETVPVNDLASYLVEGGRPADSVTIAEVDSGTASPSSIRLASEA